MPGKPSFLVAGMGVALALVLVVPLLGGVFPSLPVPAAVARGYAVWRAFGCAGCHTINGQGGLYAPDLTHIYAQRGETYLRAFLVDPAAFYPTADRIMPRLGLTVSETGDVLAFLQWIDSSNAAFPPRPILVSGGTLSLGDPVVVPTAENIPADPVEAGYYWFSRPPANCATCHSLEPGVVIVGPSLDGIAARAASRVPTVPAATYIRQSILDPGAYVVEGFPDAMARNLGDALTADQINSIITFLLSLDAGG